MRRFFEQNRFLVICLTVTFFCGLFLVHNLGFWNMAMTILPNPERLRDYTFPVWEQHPFYKHGFLVFITKDGFNEGIGYSNHSTAYMLFMYFFYKIELFSARLPMRVLTAYVEMLFLVLVVVHIVSTEKKDRLSLAQGVLLVLAILFLVTMPDYWISAGKFNVDNPFHLQLPLLLLIAYQLSFGVFRGPRVWIPTVLYCLLFPMMGALVGTYMVMASIQEKGLRREVLEFGLVVILISLIVYLQPVLTAKILGFKSANSAWIHRAGLEGDTASFNNAVNSVIRPFYPRPLYLLLAPLVLLAAQLLWVKLGSSTEGRGSIVPTEFSRLKGFLALLFSQYFIILLLWPQSVSIHPYLYDYLLVGSGCVWIVLNCVWSESISKSFKAWIWMFLFFISFNLQQITQAKQCFYCFYPTWTPNQHVIKP